jgi:hypothetical protein
MKELIIAGKQWREDRKLFNRAMMKKATYDVFLEKSNLEGKRFVKLLALQGTTGEPFVPDHLFHKCFLRILVESREYFNC